MNELYPSDGSTTSNGNYLQTHVPVRGSNYDENPKSRSFLGAQLLSQFFRNNNRLVTVTSTVLSTTVSTVNVASIQSCIGPFQFSTKAAAPPVPATTFTAACSRRRRDIFIDETGGLVEAIEPALVEP